MISVSNLPFVSKHKDSDEQNDKTKGQTFNRTGGGLKSIKEGWCFKQGARVFLIFKIILQNFQRGEENVYIFYYKDRVSVSLKSTQYME